VKIAVTGHTSGIGLAIKNFMIAQGHDVRGFSRTNGYDISKDGTLEQIVDECKDVDIFFNNAYFDFQQTKLLYSLYQSWKDQRRTIVNIGTIRTQKQDYTYLDRPNYPLHYWTTKSSLDNACLFLRGLSTWPRVMLVKPCGVATERNSAYQVKKIPSEDFADLVCHAVLEPRCRIQEISYEVHPD